MVQDLKAHIEKEFNGEVVAPIKTLTVFTHPVVELEVEGTAVPVCKLEKLRKQATIISERLSPESYNKLSSFLERLTLD
jgi:hypothetical protein